MIRHQRMRSVPWVVWKDSQEENGCWPRKHRLNRDCQVGPWLLPASGTYPPQKDLFIYKIIVRANFLSIKSSVFINKLFSLHVYNDRTNYPAPTDTTPHFPTEPFWLDLSWTLVLLYVVFPTKISKKLKIWKYRIMIMAWTNRCRF